jgi:hypothetical protein
VAAACAGSVGIKSLVSWCGSVGGFAEPHPENRSDGTVQIFRQNQERLLPVLKENGVSLLFEPWLDHVLGDENLTAIACMVDREHFKAVLDLPNFISPAQWPDRKKRIGEIRSTLSHHVGVVHLKDMLVNDEGVVELPMFGRGELTWELAEAYKPFVGNTVIIAEHLPSTGDIPELLESVLAHF